MNRPCSKVVGLLQAGAVFTITAFGQSLVEPAGVPVERQLFDAAAGASQLRCSVSPVRPALNFSFRFQTGYTIDIPLTQLKGAGHGLIFHARVTPAGLPPVYLSHDATLPPVPDTKVEAETGGTFLIGEGSYAVEVLLEDDRHRFCRGAFQIKAQLTGSERQLKTTMLPGAVEELSASLAPPPDSAHGPRIGRLTILLHAAPLSLDSSKLQPDDIDRLADSISSLLRELPAQSVRLVAFNLEQRVIVFRKDEFETKQIGELATALDHLELGAVDYRILQRPGKPIELLTSLVQAELQAPAPPDALIVMGPRTRIYDDVPPDSVSARAAAGPPIFHLEYSFGRLIPSPGIDTGPASMGPGPRRGGVGGQARGPTSTMVTARALDSIERLMGRLKAEMIPIRTAHDLADAIRHMDPRIPKTASPAKVTSQEATQKVEATADAKRSVRADVPVRAEAPGAILTVPAPSPTRTEPGATTDPAGGEDPVEVLMRLRDQIVSHGERIPNHTCVETVQRDRLEPATGRLLKSCDTVLASRKLDAQRRLRLDRTDWLRLDVALTTDREIYSWAGASKFEEGEIDELVPEGAMGTGPFAALLLSIFQPHGPKFIFEGETTVDLQRLFEYSFKVPEDQSHYRVRAKKEWLITGYTGTLLVDPKTADLFRVVVRTEELQPATDMCQIDTSLEYALIHLGEDDYMLPKVARQRFIGRDGAEGENSVSFSACREYQAESKLSFGEGKPTGGLSSDNPGAALALPPGLPVSVELAAVIHAGKAAAGDSIEGRLAEPIRDGQQKVLVPAGAVVQGRLMRVETRFLPHPVFTVALRWETIRIGEITSPVSLTPNRQPADPKPGARAGLLRRGVEFELPLPSEGTYGVYHVPGGTALGRGFRSEWFTAKP
jgi:hypothetical protein